MEGKMKPGPIIDSQTYEQLEAEMGADFMSELVDTYLKDTIRLMVELRQALSDQDAERFRRAAHTIKATSSTFGAVQLGASARELEMLGKENKLAEAAARMEPLAEQFECVRKAFEDSINPSRL
jgi:histidine phosphotransfer protein HptB